MSGLHAPDEPRREAWYRAVWRWHFYAGILCIPFVLWLSLTGALYLFKPQIEAALYAPYREVASATTLPASAIAASAVAAQPGFVLHAYVLPDSPRDAVQVLVGKDEQEVRVWVHPETVAILHQVPEEDRLMRVVFRLHGELLAGDFGSALVETAACWTIVMLATGLFLWWPRGGKRLAGALYPRLRSGRKLFWRDIHAVVGLWVSLGALFLIISGLPWAKAWGDYFREVRLASGTLQGPQDWSSGSKADAAARLDRDRALRKVSEHSAHHGGTMSHVSALPPGLDAVVNRANRLGFAGPVLVRPPTYGGAPWQIRSEADNRPRRDNAEIDEQGRLVGIARFADRHWLDKAVGYGVAIHEGAWAGITNQIVNLAVLLGLVTLCVSSIVLWWRRRPIEKLGAPAALAPLRHSCAMVALVLILALMLPLFGLSLAVAVTIEAVFKRSAPALSRWMGWRAPDGG